MVKRTEISVSHQFSCHGKVSYGTWGKASGDAKHLKKKVGRHVEPYHCNFCGGIHLGSPIGYRMAPRRIRPSAFA